MAEQETQPLAADNSIRVEESAQVKTTEPASELDFCSKIIVFFVYILVILTFPLSLIKCIRIVREYERAVIFRMGRMLAGGAVGPGLFFVLPCIDDAVTVDMRTETTDVDPQEVLTKDSVTVTVDAVVYMRIFDPVLSVTKVEFPRYSTMLLASTTLRNTLATKTLKEILRDRDSIAKTLKTELDVSTDKWGICVERVELKNVSLPTSMQRSMATEAEAGRDAKAKVIAAEGEQKASLALKEAADMVSGNPIALQLRYLQTLSDISTEKNSTIIFPIPIEMMPNLTSLEKSRE